MDNSLIETFLLVNSLGSLAAAARQIGISPAAVSKQMNKLEQEAGIQLLLRSTRKVELTEFGESFYQQCLRVHEEMDVLDALIAHVKSVPSGQLKVVSNRHFAASYIIPFIHEFQTKYPNIVLNLELAERIPDFSLENLDVLIGMSVSATGDVIQKRIASTRYVLCGSKGYLKKYGTPKTFTELLKHRYITHSMRKPDDEIFGAGQSIKIKPFIRVNDVQTMLKLSLEGLGIVMLHQYVVEEYLVSGELKEILPQFFSQEIPLYVAYPQRKFLPSKVRCFIDFVLEKLKPLQ